MEYNQTMTASRTSLLVGALLLLFALPVICADEAEEKKPLQYFELKPSVVANMQKGAKYIRTDIQLMTRADESLEEITLHAPALRHELFLLISEQEGSKLKEPKGKEAFRKIALKSLQKVMMDLTGKGAIDDLYFTSFFVQ